ncbi:MAG: outer membrane protein insertion porin family, partial [Halieaceae bacterium]
NSAYCINGWHLMKRNSLWVLLWAALFSPQLLAQNFVISDIRVEGLQRISAGSVFTALPVGVGDGIDADVIRQASRALFRTGNFDDISIGRDGSVLVVIVTERPSISEISIDGNKAIETEALLEGLKGAGLAEGQVFKRSTLEGMQLELQRQYVQQGRYDADIETEVIPEPRNRVSVNIHVDEGSVASIQHINVVGNKVFNDEELLEQIELKKTNWLSFIRSDDKYSKEKMTGDIETITSFYLDRGYLKFSVDSTQVSVTPDRSSVYITANVTEGDKYTVGSVELSGDLVLPESDLRRFLIVAEDQTFSQRLVTSSEEYLTQRLGNEGYNFAEVTGIPEIEGDSTIVAMKFFIDPGKRTYVRRINFKGNLRTVDEVLRREMRQMESAPASSSAIEQSRVRLERLGFFKQATVDTREVPGHDDLIDIEFEVEEQSSGSISASFGYAQGTGAIFGLNLQQDNFLGSGKQVGIGLNSSSYQDSYNFSYLDPYFTEDGVSRGFSVFFRSTDLDKVNVSSYSTDTLGAAVNFGYPLSETQRLGFSFGVSNTAITVGRFAVQEISGSPRLQDGVDNWFESTEVLNESGFGTGVYDAIEELQAISTLPESALTPPTITGFLDDNGDDYDNFTFSASWSQSKLNRGRLATRGFSQRINLEATVPGSDLEFFKLVYTGEYFYPIANNWTLRFRTELGYGDGYGGTTELPFYEHFFAGGFGSVRGFESHSLGPQDSPAVLYRLGTPVTAITEDGVPTQTGGDDGRSFGYAVRNGKIALDGVADDPDPIGGNVLFEGSIELLFPMPFVKDRRSLRSAFFIDSGNVFNTNCRSSQLNCFDVNFDELRYSVGLGVTWITGFGPLTFSIAKPINSGDEDEEEAFQFSLGRGF